MVKKYTPEQFWQLFQKLPSDLKDALFAEDTSRAIEDICKRNKISNSFSQLANIVEQVLIGILPPAEFEEAIREELKLKKEVAKKIAREIHRFVFFPVKSSLEEIYKIEVAPPAKPKIAPPKREIPKEKPKVDIYREPIE